MESMQTRLTGKVVTLVEAELGLEVGDSQNFSNQGTWYVHAGPDMLDVPLLVGQELEQADPSEVEGSDGGRYEVISYEVAPHE